MGSKRQFLLFSLDLLIKRDGVFLRKRFAASSQIGKLIDIFPLFAAARPIVFEAWD
jgi:hypothetical protein